MTKDKLEITNCDLKSKEEAEVSEEMIEEPCKCNFSKAVHDLFRDEAYTYCPYCAMRIKELNK